MKKYQIKQIGIDIYQIKYYSNSVRKFFKIANAVFYAAGYTAAWEMIQADKQMRADLSFIGWQ